MQVLFWYLQWSRTRSYVMDIVIGCSSFVKYYKNKSVIYVVITV
jgi:hypothetical protein